MTTIPNDPAATLTQTQAPSPHVLRQAFDDTAKERAALEKDDLVQVNFDVQAAAMVAMGAAKKIATLRDAIVKEAPSVDLAQIDRIATYAHAAYQAHTFFQLATKTEGELQALYDEAQKLRDVIHVDLLALANRGLVDAKSLAEHRGYVGFKNVASDLNLYVGAAREAWPKIAGKTTITSAELDRAEELVFRLTDLSADRDLAPPPTSKVAQDRQRAATLLVNAYEEARRVVTFLRAHDDDAETIVPSLFVGRTGRPRKDGKDASEEEATDAASASSSSSIAPPALHASDTTTAVPGAPRLSPFSS